MKKRYYIYAFIFLTALTFGYAQLRDYKVHQRGMLHETIFNTGEIGRAYDQGTGGSLLGVPSFEWPGYSSVDVDGVQYNGQYNSFGGGIYLATSRPDTVARFYSYCGALVGEPAAERYSFPISLERIENYPVLDNGNLNPNYNPGEADEIIISKWATNVGITVTRTSRAWSHPDYDDFIIYEYEMENTGETDRDPETPARLDTLSDVLVGFAWALNPSMFGYERTYNRWDGADMVERDLYPRFNLNRWMNYCVDGNGNPDPRYYSEWGISGKNGGGLLSPQAVGYFPLHYDTDKLALKGETKIQIPSGDTVKVFDAANKIKQPYLNRMETGVLSLAKAKDYLDNAKVRKNNPYSGGYYPYRSLYWYGRGSYNWRQSNKFGLGHILVFGPYKMLPGDKINFSIAQVAGYGAARIRELAGRDSVLWDEGGGCGERCTESDAVYNFNPIPNWTRPITWGGVNHDAWTQGSSYLYDSIANPQGYPLPEYVNSKVVTIRDVADRAIQLYTNARLKKYDGYNDSVQYKPDLSPSHGVYQIPQIVPSPIFTIETDSLARNDITWGQQVESFNNQFSRYEVSKSTHPLGPWTIIASITPADPNYFKDRKYTLIDSTVHEGEAFYYSIISVDTAGQKSGRTQITLHQTRMPGTSTLEQVYVVPNPFIVHSGFEGVTAAGGDAGQKIGFYHLPKKCTIRIYSYSGQLIETIEHESEFYSEEYMQVTRNNQVIASGVYFYVVDTPEGSRTHGKFVIIQ
jgi:hypothetical protein